MLRHRLAMLSSRMPWQEIEARVAKVFSRKRRVGVAMPDLDLFGKQVLRVPLASTAGLPRAPLRTMIALLFNESYDGVHTAMTTSLATPWDKQVEAAKDAGMDLKQTFAKEGQQMSRKAGRYANARQFKRMRRAIKRQRTIVWAAAGFMDTVLMCEDETGDGFWEREGNSAGSSNLKQSSWLRSTV